MRLRTRTLACGLIVLGLMLLSGGPALAGGGGGSAGNSQYVDPLSAQSGHSHSKSHTTSSTATTSSSSTSSGSTSGSSTLSPSAPSSVSSTSSSSGSGKTLPFTGLNLWSCIGLGLALLGGGLALRRTLARMY